MNRERRAEIYVQHPKMRPRSDYVEACTGNSEALDDGEQPAQHLAREHRVDVAGARPPSTEELGDREGPIRADGHSIFVAFDQRLHDTRSHVAAQ